MNELSSFSFRQAKQQRPLLDVSHIDISLTIAEFGYDPTSLKYYSSKKVVWRCSICSSLQRKSFRQATITVACVPCANRLKSREPTNRSKRSAAMKLYYARGGKHPTKGIGHSLESRQKMSANQKGRKVELSTETRQKLVDHCRRVLHAPEVVEKTRRINSLRRGPLCAAYGRSPAPGKRFLVENAGSFVTLRSSWEYKFAEYLNRLGVAWSYETSLFPVEYSLNGSRKEGTYRPDFLVPAHSTWYEVKGRWLEESKAKYDAFIQQYPEEKIILADRGYLKKLGIL